LNKIIFNSKTSGSKELGGVILHNKKTVAVEMGLGEVAEALKVEGFTVVPLDKAKGYVDAVVYTGSNHDWTSLTHNHAGDFKGKNFDYSHDVKTVDATDMTSRDVVIRVKEITGQTI
jgi:hypothetical protein